MLKVYQEDNKPPLVVPTWKQAVLTAHSYAWNFIRRPLVNHWKSELEKIALRVQADIKVDLLPEIYDNLRSGCPKCKDLYFYLRQAVYVSHIRSVLKHEHCQEHAAAYKTFAILHEAMFKLNHELSDKICGFKSYYKD